MKHLTRGFPKFYGIICLKVTVIDKEPSDHQMATFNFFHLLFRNQLLNYFSNDFVSIEETLMFRYNCGNTTRAINFDWLIQVDDPRITEHLASDDDCSKQFNLGQIGNFRVPNLLRIHQMLLIPEKESMFIVGWKKNMNQGTSKCCHFSKRRFFRA